MGQIDGISLKPTSTYRPDRLFKTELRVLEHLRDSKKVDETRKFTRDQLHKVSGSRGKTDLGFLQRLINADYVGNNSFGFYVTGLGEEAIYEYYKKWS